MDTKIVVKIVLTVLYFICTLLTGAAAGLQFWDDQKVPGVLYSVSCAGFMTCFILGIVELVALTK